MGVLQEFKEFAIKGNAVDMAVGIVIGAAFGTIITSLVEDLLMPPLGMLFGGSGFINLFFTLDGSEFFTLAAAKEAGAPVVGYGSFIQTTISFLIISFAVFMVVKAMNKSAAAVAAAKAEEAAPEPTEDVLLLREIRDSMATSVTKLEETHALIEVATAKPPEPEIEPEIDSDGGGEEVEVEKAPE